MSAPESSQAGKIESLKAKFWSKIRKLFEKNKKKGLSEAIKQFDGSKESISKELEEKKVVLQPKVVEIYKSAEHKVKILLKDPTESAVGRESQLVSSLLLDLKSAGFPGASSLVDSLEKFGAAAFAGPISFLLFKASVFVQDEPSPVIPAGEKEIKTVQEIPVIAQTTEKFTVPAAVGMASTADEVYEVENPEYATVEVEKATEKEGVTQAQTLDRCRDS